MERHSPPLSSGDSDDFNDRELKILRCAETFVDIRKAGAHFVDKSLLIFSLFHQNSKAPDGSMIKVHDQKPKMMLTAPRGFGKSINMDMIKCFLEIQNEEPYLILDYGYQRRDNPLYVRNYNLFEGLKIMESEYRDFVNKNFGKYPVLKVNFRCGIGLPIANKDEMIDFYRTVIHKTFKQYPFLKTSEDLSEEEKKLCKRWCSNSEYKTISEADTKQGLVDLCECLCTHFKKREAFVLIDEYDSPIIKAVFNAKINPDELSQILECYIAMLSSLLEDNRYLFGAVVTGVSYIAGIGLLTELHTLSVYRFLNNSFFVDYYGFTSGEIDELLSQCAVSDEKRSTLKDICNGYVSKDGKHTVYNPYSVVRYLADMESETDNYWVQSGCIIKLQDVFKQQDYQKHLNELLLWNHVSLSMDAKTKLEMDDLIQLAAISSGEGKVPDVHVFLSFLLEQGYLSYVGDKENNVKLPNKEIKSEFLRRLRFSYTEDHGFEREILEKCAEAFTKLFSSVVKDSEVERALEDFRFSLGALVCQSSSGIPGNVATLQQIISNPLLETGYEYGTEIFVPISKRPHFFLSNNESAVIIEMRYSGEYGLGSASRAALKQIIGNKYYTIFSNIYLPSGVKKFILMGLGYDDEFRNFSVSILQYGGGSQHVLTVEDIETKAIHSFPSVYTAYSFDE